MYSQEINKKNTKHEYLIITALFTHRAGGDIYCSLFGECQILLWLTESWSLWICMWKIDDNKAWTKSTSCLLNKNHWSKTCSERSGTIVCDVLWLIFVLYSLGTDGNASDAGWLDARHVVSRWLRSMPAHGRGRGTLEHARIQSGVHSRAEPSTWLGRSTECVVDTACDRAHHSPSEAGLSARRRRAAGGERARAPGIRLWQGGGAAPGS